MGKFDTRATFGIDFKVNKTELDTLKRELAALGKLQEKDLMALNPKLDMKEAQQQLAQIKTYSTQVQQTLNKAFNTDLGTMNVAKLSTELRKLPINDIYNSFRKAGTAGATAFNSISSAVLKGNLQLKESHALLDKIGTTFSNTIRFGLASSVFNRMTDSIQRSWEFTKQLDTSLNDIRIVTGKSADEMERYAKTASKAAQNLGATTQDYVKSSLIYYQQGLSDEETQARADVTVKTANVTGQSASTVSEQLTAIWNGYKVQASEAELYIDKVAKVAATTAADLEEMATGMSKVASAANSAGVDIDQLNAMLATVISVTREAPETIGTSFRTIFARLGDLKKGGEDEDGLGLGQISSKVAEFGINILDTKGDLREMGDVITDIAEKWDDLSRGEKQALAIAAAGKQQYSRFIALFDNWDMYTSALEDSKSAAGELQKQQDIYMESTEAHLNKLTAAQERVGNAFVDNKGVNSMIDGVTTLTNVFANFIESLGGGAGLLLNLGSIGLRVFDKQLASGINGFIKDMQVAKQNARVLEQQLSDLKWMQSELKNNKNGPTSDAGLDTKIQYREQMQQFASNMSPADIDQTNTLIDKLGEAVSQREQYNQKYERTLQLATAMSQIIENENAKKEGRQAEKVEDVTDIYKEVNPDAEIYQRLEQDIQPQLEATIDTFTRLKQAEQTYINKDTNNNIDEVVDSYIDLENGIEAVALQAEKLRKSGLDVGMKPEELDKVDDAITEIMKIWANEDMAQGDGPFDELLGTDGEWTASFNTKLKLLEDFIKTVQQRVREGTEVINTENSTQGQERQHQDENVDFHTRNVEDAFDEQKREQTIQNILQVTGAVGGLTSACQTFIGLGDIWQNENLTTGEKVFQIVSATTMGIGQLITSTIALKTNTFKLIAAIAGEAAAEKIKNIEKAKGIKLTAAEILSIQLQTIKEKLLNGELLKEIMLQMAKHKILLLVAIAIAAVTVAVWAAVKAYNADAEAAKKATEAAQEATEAYNTMKSAYESLVDAITDYKEGKDALAEMATGTEEWNDKVKELNQSVLDLIATYPELAAKVKNISGQLILEDEDLKDFQNQQKIKLENANNAKISANRNARELTTKSEQTDLQRQINNGGFWESMAIGAGATAIGAAIGTAIAPGIGTAIGAGIGAIVGAVGGTAHSESSTLSDNQMSNLLKKMEETNYAILDDKNALAELGITDEGLIQALKDNRGSLIDLTNEIKTNRLAEQVEKQQQIHNTLSSTSPAYQALDTETQTQVSSSMANFLDEVAEKYSSEIESKSIDDIAREYAKATGIDYNGKPTEKDGNITYKVKDSEGNESELTVATDTAKSFLKTQKAIDELNKNTGAFIDSVRKLNDSYHGASDEIKTVVKSMTNGEIPNLEGLTQQQALNFSQIDFSQLTDIDAQHLGFADLADMMTKIGTAYSNFQEEWNKVGDQLSKTPKQYLDNIENNDKIDLSKVTLKGKKDMATALQELYKNFGTEGLDSYTKVLEAAGDDADELVNIISKWDWSKTGALKDFKDMLLENLDLPEEDVNRFVSQVGAIKDTLSSLTVESLTAFNAVVDKLAAGKSVNENDFAAIEQILGSDVNQYFTTMADGTHQLIISAERLKEIAFDIQFDKVMTKLETNLENFDKRRENVTNAKANALTEDERNNITNKYNDKRNQTNSNYDQKRRDKLIENRPQWKDWDNENLDKQIEFLLAEGEQADKTRQLAIQGGSYDVYERRKEQQEIEQERSKAIDNDNRLEQYELHIQKLHDMADTLKITTDQFEAWENAYNSGEISADMWDEISGKINEADTSINNLDSDYNKMIESFAKEAYDVFTLVDDLSVLKEKYSQVRNVKTTDPNAKQAALDAYNKRAVELDEAKRYDGIDNKELTEYTKHLQEVAKDSKTVSKELTENADAAEVLALQVMRMNKGVDTLADNFKDWKSILKSSSKESQEYGEAMLGIKEAMYDLTGVSEEYISNDYVIRHMKELEAAATGDAEAIDKLRSDLTEEIVAQIAVENNLEGADLEKFKNQWAELQGMAKDFQAGVTINGTEEFAQKAEQMIQDSAMTADQINNLFRSIKLEPNIKMIGKEITHKVPTQVEHWTGEESEPEVKNEDGEVIKPASMKRTKWVTQGQPVEATEWMEVPSLTTDGSDPKSRVSFTTLGGGSMNNYSADNKGGKAPGKNSKSGGSEKKAKKKDKLDDKPDRYHKVDTQLTKIGNQLSKIQSQEKKFIGTKLIENLNGQLEKLDRRIDNLRQKQKIAYGELDELKNKLAPQGVTFNEDGTIANYMEIYNSKLNYVNSLIDKYNGMSADEQEAFEDTLEAAKKDYEKFKDDLDRYDELVSDFIPGLENEIQDAIDEEIELNIKKFNLEFEVKLDIADAKKDWNEFKRKILDDIDDDDILGNARARATDDLGVYLAGTDGKDGLLGAGLKQTESILKELKDMDEKGWSNVYGDDRVSALEDLQEAYQNVEQSLMEIKEIQEDVAQAVLNQMDAVVDAMDKVADLMDTVDSQIEHDIKVIEMVYGETDYDAKAKYMEKRQQNNLDTLGAARENRDYWEQQMNLIDDKTSEAYQKAQENFFKYNDAVNDAIEKSIEDAQEKAENAIDGIFKKYNDEITNGKGLDYTEQQWELVNDVADQYLDKVNAAFEIRQLEGKWKDAIDQTDNVGAQRKLNDLMEEQLKKLREKDKLTEYDIERAEKEYEIALKKLALEEAQQTKSTMRLRRDSQGNYRYEYVADEDQIAKLQDELDVLENSLYNFDKERWLEMQNQVVDAVRDRQDAIKEILMDASLTEEERLERLEEINKLYNEKIQNITDQAVTAQTNLYDSGATEIAKIWDEEGKDFQALSDEEKRILVEEMLPQFETGVNDMIDKFSGPDGFEETTVGSMEELSQATQDYQNDLGDVEDQAGITFDEIRDGQDDVLDKMPDMIDDAEDYVDVMEDELGQLQDINAELQKKLLYYQQISTAAKAAATEAYNYWLKEQQIAAEKYAQENAKKNDNAGGNNGNTGSGGNGSSGSGSGGKATLSAYDAVGVAAAISLGQNYGGWGVGQDRANKLAAKFTNDNDVQAVINRNNGYKNSKGEFNAYKDKLENYYYNRFNTGGYTGDWVGDYGKFAMLDRKELVLNAHDTENMLDMLAITRDVVAMSGPRSGLARIMTPNTDSDVLEQNVHIEANFPNAESAEEIKEAINSLVNLAAQRASRNGRG